MPLADCRAVDAVSDNDCERSLFLQWRPLERQQADVRNTDQITFAFVK